MVLILLPPSEGKARRSRGRPADPATWSFPELAPLRARVAEALADVSASPDAPRLLGVSPGLLDEIARNLVLGTAPALPAGECYTGVLYDALDLAGLSPAARRRAHRWIVVVSALYGAVRLTDRIAPYRLAMGVDLPGVGPLARSWRPLLTPVLTGAAGRGVVVDARSTAYAAAGAIEGDAAARWAALTVPGASHLAKHTRGLAVRHLCQAGVAARSVPEVAEVLAERFAVEVHEPERAGKPWTLALRAL